MDVLDLVNDSNQVGPGHDFMVRPFVCRYDSCDRAFARKSDLARHFRIHTNERPFVCMYRGCGKAFIQRSALTVHTRVHTGERPHHCETCNKAFADSSSLARHRRIHTGKRPYGCKVAGCGRQFARRNTYLKHFKRQHPELPPPTSNSVRALHVPSFRGQPGYMGAGSSASVPPSAADSNEYVTSPNGTSAPFTPSQAPDSASYPYTGGFVNGMLHSSQLAAHSAHLRPYFHAEAQHSPLSHAGGPESAHPHMPGDRHAQIHHPNGLTYGDASSQHGHVSLGHPEYSTGEQAEFAYPDNAMARVQSNPVMSSNGGVYFKHDPQSATMRAFPADPNQMGMLPQGAWGGVGGGFNPSQIAIPNSAQSAYFGGFPQQPMSGSIKMEQQQKTEQSPDSNSAGSPELADVNGVSKFQQQQQQHPMTPYQMVFSNGMPVHSHMPSPVIHSMPPHSGQSQLHAVPPQMQRFHSAPILPTASNSGWPQGEQFKASTPGYDNRVPPFRRSQPHLEGWQVPEQARSREMSEAEGDASSAKDINSTPSKQGWEAPPSYPSVPGMRFADNTDQFRYASNASTASTNSSLGNIQTPQSLPPINIFHQGLPTPTTYYPPEAQSATGSWTSVPPKDLCLSVPMLGKPMYAQGVDEQSPDGLESPTKIPMNRERQVSGVSSVGLGLANVSFGEASGEEDDKSWTPSDSDSDIEGQEEDEAESDGSDDAAEDSDDEFVLGKPRRKAPVKGFSARRARRVAA